MIKRLLLTLFSTFFLSTLAYSQADQVPEAQGPSFRANRIAVTVGMGIPNGDFASTDITDQASGYAENGFTFKINYAYFFVDYFGFTVDFSNATFNVDDGELSALNLALLEDVATNLKYTVGDYSSNQFTFGFIARFGNTTKVYFNPAIGYSTFKFPTQAISGQYVRNSIGLPEGATFNQRASAPSDEDMFWILNVGLDAPLSSSVNLNINMGYYSTDYQFDGSINYSDSQGNAASQAFIYDQDVAAIQLTIGISHTF